MNRRIVVIVKFLLILFSPPPFFLELMIRNYLFEIFYEILLMIAGNCFNGKNTLTDTVFVFRGLHVESICKKIYRQVFHLRHILVNDSAPSLSMPPKTRNYNLIF